MPTCTVVTCKSGYHAHPTPKEVQWFQFPVENFRNSSKVLLEKWKSRLNRKGFIPTKHTRICSLHFKNEDYIPESENMDRFGRKLKKRRLKPNAAPSLLMGYEISGMFFPTKINSVILILRIPIFKPIIQQFLTFQNVKIIQKWILNRKQRIKNRI